MVVKTWYGLVNRFSNDITLLYFIHHLTLMTFGNYCKGRQMKILLKISKNVIIKCDRYYKVEKLFSMWQYSAKFYHYRDVHSKDFKRGVNQKTLLSVSRHIKTSLDSSVPKQLPNKNQILKVKSPFHADAADTLSPAVQYPEVSRADLSI